MITVSEGNLTNNKTTRHLTSNYKRVYCVKKQNKAIYINLKNYLFHDIQIFLDVPVCIYIYIYIYKKVHLNKLSKYVNTNLKLYL